MYNQYKLYQKDYKYERQNNKNEYAGTGIGLASCSKIINLQGGKIWVESKKGEGSTFFFTIMK